MLQQGLEVIKSLSAWHGVKAAESFENDAIFDYIFELTVEDLFYSNVFGVSHGFRFLDYSLGREVWLRWWNIFQRRLRWGSGVII